MASDGSQHGGVASRCEGFLSSDAIEWRTNDASPFAPSLLESHPASLLMSAEELSEPPG